MRFSSIILFNTKDIILSISMFWEQGIYFSPDDRGSGVGRKDVIQSLQIGGSVYDFSEEMQQYFRPHFISKYEHSTSVVILSEPHESSEGQFNLFRGLELFFARYPGIIPKTIFLSEGTAANKPISIQELIAEESHPSDETIRQVLQSHLITGYMAYEWKYQRGIPIIGTEEQRLYELSRRFASLCREDPNAIFQHRKYPDGTEFDIPLWYAWAFAVAARNKRIAQTLIEQVGTYHNPMLFVARDHIKDQRIRHAKKWDDIIKRNMIDAQYIGPLGPLMFPWSKKGADWWLYQNVSADDETFDIHHYLEEARIEYTFLEVEGDITTEDSENYKRIFCAQGEE